MGLELGLLVFVQEIWTVAVMNYPKRGKTTWVISGFCLFVSVVTVVMLIRENRGLRLEKIPPSRIEKIREEAGRLLSSFPEVNSRLIVGGNQSGKVAMVAPEISSLGVRGATKEFSISVDRNGVRHFLLKFRKDRLFSQEFLLLRIYPNGQPDLIGSPYFLPGDPSEYERLGEGVFQSQYEMVR